jgi:acetyl esterase/lipase
MRTCSTLLGALCLVALSLAAARAEQRNDLGPYGEEGAGTATTPPAARRVERDVAYGPDPAQRFDVYLPRHATASMPVLFMVHGGAWLVGDNASAGVVDNKAAHWLPKGIVFISVNYRLSPKADPLGQADDVARALAAAQQRAPSWGADPARFVLMGHSAGAHLVALLSADPAIAARQGARPWLGTVELDSAALDLVAIMQGRHLRLYDRVLKSDPSYWRAASPLERLTGKPAPILAVCSSRRHDSCAHAQEFVAKAKALGGRASVQPEALTHAEINKTLGQPGPYTDAVDAFLRSIGVP